MPSATLKAFLAALEEVRELGKASHPTLGPNAPASLALARAVGRGQVVLLSSHFERYIYSINEELCAFLNSISLYGDRLPERIRLQHSALPVDELSKTGWENRTDQLTSFVAEDGWLWLAATTGSIRHERLLTWMKAPMPESLVRYYKCWGINDIFSVVTRRKTTREALWLGVKGLVELRNNIAHGDFTAQATQADVARYIRSIRQFCERADRTLARHIARTFGVRSPW